MKDLLKDLTWELILQLKEKTRSTVVSRFVIVVVAGLLSSGTF